MRTSNTHLIAATCLSAALISCSGSEEHSITGRFDHAGGKKIVLSIVTDTGERAVDSTTADGRGNFTLRNTADSADFYTLRTDDENFIYLLLEGNENIELNGDANRLESTYQVSGSKDCELLRSLRNTERSLTDSLNGAYEAWRTSHPESADSMGIRLQSIYTERMHVFARSLVQANPSSLIGLSATKFLDQSTDQPLMAMMLDSLQQRYPGNPFVSDFANLMSAMRRLPVGSPAPEISLPAAKGGTIRLSDLKGKVVLVDFWASWCGPCRQANPELVRIYAKHKGPDFEILGVSLDENAMSWKGAIEKDGLNWPQVSELKKWDSQCVQDYSIDAIPYSVLVDRSGNIASKGLRPDEIEPALINLLRKNP